MQLKVYNASRQYIKNLCFCHFYLFSQKSCFYYVVFIGVPSEILFQSYFYLYGYVVARVLIACWLFPTVDLPLL